MFLLKLIFNGEEEPKVDISLPELLGLPPCPSKYALVTVPNQHELLEIRRLLCLELSHLNDENMQRVVITKILEVHD